MARRRMTYICLAAIVVLVALVFLGLWLRLKDGPGLRFNQVVTWRAIRAGVSFENVVPYGLGVTRFFATLISVVFAGTMMGNEYDWRTVGLVVSRGVRRWHFLVAKATICVGFTLLVVVVGLGASAVLSAIMTSGYDLSWGSFGGGWWLDLVASVARTTFVILPFVFLAVLFGLLWKSGGQAVGASLGVFFSEQVFNGLLGLAEGWPREIPKALFSVNIDAVMRANGIFANGGAPFILSPGGPPTWRAALILGGWTAFFVAVLFWRFQRRDIQE